MPANINVATGEVEGTGAIINVSIGFIPKKVVLYNIDDAGTLAPKLEWTGGMADDAAYKFLQTNISASVNSVEYITSDGITPYAGTGGGDSQGFSIGADGDINVSAETIIWEAYR